MNNTVVFFLYNKTKLSQKLQEAHDHNKFSLQQQQSAELSAESEI